MVSRIVQKVTAELSAGKDKGKGKGKAGKTDGKGKVKGKGEKIPCINYWCTARTYRSDPACHFCYAPLDKDGSSARAVAAEAKAAAEAPDEWVQPPRVKKKNGQKARAAKKAAEAANVAAKVAVADEARLGNKPSFLNAAAVKAENLFEADTASQMEVDSHERANPPSVVALNSADDLKRLGLPLVPVATANLGALLTAFRERDALASPVEVVAAAASAALGKKTSTVVSEKVADLEKQITLLSKVANSGPTLQFMKERVAEEKLAVGTSVPVAVTAVALEKMKSQRQEAREKRSVMVAAAEKSRAGAMARQD